jgi:hypothetical protein
VEDCCNVFNSGVMVLHPSKEVYDDMMRKTKTLPSYRQHLIQHLAIEISGGGGKFLMHHKPHAHYA